MSVGVSIPKKNSSGGGGIGGLLGAIGGAVAAPFTGGSSLAGVLGLANAGHGIGSIVGNAASPGSQGQEVGVPVEDSSAFNRKIAENTDIPQVHLHAAISALPEMDDETRKLVAGPLMTAYHMGRTNGWGGNQE